jgi:hypothetical protein
MGHIWLGFSEARITAELHDAGFDRVRVTRLPSEPGVKGPTLFAAIGRRVPVEAELNPVGVGDADAGQTA